MEKGHVHLWKQGACINGVPTSGNMEHVEKACPPLEKRSMYKEHAHLLKQGARKKACPPVETRSMCKGHAHLLKKGT